MFSIPFYYHWFENMDMQHQLLYLDVVVHIGISAVYNICFPRFIVAILIIIHWTCSYHLRLYITLKQIHLKSDTRMPKRPWPKESVTQIITTVYMRLILSNCESTVKKNQIITRIDATKEM